MIGVAVAATSSNGCWWPSDFSNDCRMRSWKLSRSVRVRLFIGEKWTRWIIGLILWRHQSMSASTGSSCCFLLLLKINETVFFYWPSPLFLNNKYRSVFALSINNQPTREIRAVRSSLSPIIIIVFASSLGVCCNSNNWSRRAGRICGFKVTHIQPHFFYKRTTVVRSVADGLLTIFASSILENLLLVNTSTKKTYKVHLY